MCKTQNSKNFGSIFVRKRILIPNDEARLRGAKCEFRNLTVKG